MKAIEEILEGVGPRRAQALRHAGFTTVESIAMADWQTLAMLDGFGSWTAKVVRNNARHYLKRY